MPFNIDKARRDGWTDPEINSYLSKTGRSIQSIEAAKPGLGSKVARGVVERGPQVGSFTAGFSGPIGTTAGYSIGHSLQRILQEMDKGGTDVLANIMGRRKAQDLTPYGQQRAEQEFGPEFSYGKAALGNVTNPQNLLEAGKFAGSNVLGSLVSGGLDLALGGYRGPDTLFKGRPMQVTVPNKITNVKGVFPTLLEKVGGPLTKAKGLKAETIETSSRAAADDAWKVIQDNIDEGVEGGKTIHINDIIDDLQRSQDELSKGLSPEKIANTRIADKVQGYQTVIDDLKAISKSTGNDEIVSLIDDTYQLTPQGVQTFKSILGEESFGRRTGVERVFSGLFEGGEQKARKKAGGMLREKMIDYLESSGVDDAAKLYDDWAKLNEMANLSGQGFEALFRKGIFLPGMMSGTLGALGLLAGSPGVGLTAGPALWATMTPYGRQLLRELALKPTVNALSTGSRYLIPSTVSNLMNMGGQEPGELER